MKKSDSKVDLSIVIVSYNTKDLTKVCLDSVIKHTKGLDYEILAADNASSDGSAEMLEEYASKDERVIYIQTGENLGFGIANNVGIAKAKGRYILLLNSDTEIGDNLFPKMISWMENYPKAGVASCKLLNKDGTIQGTGGSFPTLSKVFAWMFFIEDIPFIEKLFVPYHPMHPLSFYKGGSLFAKRRQLDWLTGAFLLIKKQVLDEAGIFDKEFFMYVEEVELCYRIKKAGWQIWYLPDWSIVHYGGASAGGEFSLLSEYKGIRIFYKKHLDKIQNILLGVLLKCGAFLRIIIFTLMGKIKLAKVYVKAFTSA